VFQQPKKPKLKNSEKRPRPTAPTYNHTLHSALLPVRDGWGAFRKEDGSAPVLVDCVLSKPARSRELNETLSRLTTKSQKAALANQRG
jgi:hypothetical protein